ncbi:unnamed protein product [Sympodiomycopsis kandeliae]
MYNLADIRPKSSADGSNKRAFSAQDAKPPAVRPSADGVDQRVLLPFLERPVEVDELLFHTPCNSQLAIRLHSFFEGRGPNGKELRNTLLSVDRDQMGDSVWIAQVRRLTETSKPELWHQLEQTLGAEGVCSHDNKDSLSIPRPTVSFKPDEEETEPSSSSSRQPLNSPRATVNVADGVNEASSRETNNDQFTDVLHPKEAASGRSTTQSDTSITDNSSRFFQHRHQPCMASSWTFSSAADGNERTKPLVARDGASNNAAGGSKPSASKEMRTARPLSTRMVDDAELLSPQKSKYSFARTFEGPTLANARGGTRPKSYSMTQYSSNVEQSRLDLGREGEVIPCEVAAELEQKGAEKPVNLGVLNDGRTKHPFAGQTRNPSLVASFHPAVGLTPASPKLAAESDNESHSDGDCSQNQSIIGQTRHEASHPDSSTSTASTPHSGSTQSIPQNQGDRSDPTVTEPSHNPSRPSVSSRGSGFALSYKSLHRRSSTNTVSPSKQPVLSGSQRGQHKEVPWSPDGYSRPGGFVTFSEDSAAAKARRTRSISDMGPSLPSTSSQAPRAHGTAVFSKSDKRNQYLATHTSNQPLTDEASGGRAGSTDTARGLPPGEFGLDFGDGVNEESREAFVTAPLASPHVRTYSDTQIWAAPESPSRCSDEHAFEAPLSPRGLRGLDHIIIPVSPGAERSRSQFIGSVLESESFEKIAVKARCAIGNSAWQKATFLLTRAERQALNDKELLEQLATNCFGLVDLDAVDLKEREDAEKLVCEDLEAYTRKWEAFHDLLKGLGVPLSSISEAERRCSPGSIMC